MEPKASGGSAAESPTRQLLLEAAKREISGHGYNDVSLRNVARGADVDPSLVRHYFGSKQNLLIAAVSAEYDVAELIAGVLRGPQHLVGQRLVKALIDLWEAPATSSTLIARLSASLTSPEIAEMVKQDFIVAFFGAVADEVCPDHHRLRAELAAAHVMAMALTQYLVVGAGLTDQDRVERAAIAGRSVQHYLTDPLPAEVVGARSR